MEDQLENLQEFISGSSIKKQEITLVLLGETGVGKSSWINTLANQLHYKTLEDALAQKKLYVPIYTKFSHHEKSDGLFKEIVLGDADELYDKKRTVAESSTRYPCSYTIKTGNNFDITIIDTPGMGDTGATVETDQSCSGVTATTGDENNYGSSDVDNNIVISILDHLSMFHEFIHAFVILMKPDEERKTKYMISVLQKLLNQLHKSAKANVIFAFTHGANTEFMPSSSIPVLREILKEFNLDIPIGTTNCFYFESSPFRYLAIKCKNYTQNTSKTLKLYKAIMEENWEKTSDSYVRLLKHLNTLEPHNTKVTTSIQVVRTNINIMTDPLLEICKSIRETHQLIFDRIKETNQRITRQENVDKVLSIKGTELVYKQLKKPQTICCNSTCSSEETFKMAGKRLTKANNRRICCEDCKLPLVPLEKKGAFLLHFCWSLKFRSCVNCGHHLKEHMHITYELEEVEKLIEGNSKYLYKKMALLETEYSEIVKAVAMFMYYLKENKLLTFNDSVTTDIDEEIKKQRINSDAERVELLRELKDRYERELAQFTGKESPSETDVDEKIKSLFKLKENGKKLKTIFKNIKQTHQAYLKRSVNVKKVFTLSRNDDQAKLIPSKIFEEMLPGQSQQVEQHQCQIQQQDNHDQQQQENDTLFVYFKKIWAS